VNGSGKAKLAVLIDADNAQPGIAAALLGEIATYGTAHVKRAYGDWTTTHLTGWKDQLLTLSIQPIQQFRYTSGKNATDSAMVIDAMDLLYTNRFDGFCLVSSDSDFTRLAARIREAGLSVYGFGERKTPTPFVAACDKFIHTENLTRAHTPAAAGPASSSSSGPSRTRASNSNCSPGSTSAPVELLRDAVEAVSGEDGWAYLSKVGHVITSRRPDFDSRTWGHRKLNDFLDALGVFELDRRRLPGSKDTVIYVRNRPRATIPVTGTEAGVR
jgi:hypothetical protein